MNVDVLRAVLGWCAVINYGVLLWWFLVFWFAHNWIYRFHGQWFPMPVEQFNALHYGAMAGYKIGVLLFNVVPYVALLIVSRTASRKA
jgi:hypothetical protein